MVGDRQSVDGVVVVVAAGVSYRLFLTRSRSRTYCGRLTARLMWLAPAVTSSFGLRRRCLLSSFLLLEEIGEMHVLVQ